MRAKAGDASYYSGEVGVFLYYSAGFGIQEWRSASRAKPSHWISWTWYPFSACLLSTQGRHANLFATKYGIIMIIRGAKETVPETNFAESDAKYQTNHNEAEPPSLIAS